MATMWNVTTYPDPARFKADVEPFLLQHEAEHCVGLGVLDSLVTTPGRYPKHYLFAVTENNTIAGAAWFTPPWPLGLSMMPHAALRLILDETARLPDCPSAVMGPASVAEKFKEEWTRRQRVRTSGQMRQRLYRAVKAIPPSGVPGTMRGVEARDLDLLDIWNRSFSEDCGLGMEAEQARQEAEAAVKAKSRYLWEVDGQPVSMAGASGPTPSGIRVNWVYTPENLRGKGYASALVAALTTKLLGEGRRFCFLFTDLANPTSNSIYQKVGYEPLSDFALYTFG